MDCLVLSSRHRGFITHHACVVQVSLSQQHKVANCFPGAVAPDHVSDSRILMEAMNAMRDMQLFIQGIPTEIPLPNMLVALQVHAVLAGKKRWTFY